MKKYIVIILILSANYAQEFGANLMQPDEVSDLISIDDLSYTPIEKPIDPNTYILGPGDLLGINIISSKNISLPIRVNLVGEIMIPTVGILNINGISLSEAKNKISDYIIENVFQNAIVNVTLINVRNFRIQVLGAVNKPGFINVTPMDRVYDVILKSNGVQKIAHTDIIQIIRDEKTIDVKLKEYLSGKDISQNMELKPGDVIYVPFSNNAVSLGLNIGQYHKQGVIVSGFISPNGENNYYGYSPGYTARDYIALVGGIKDPGASIRSGNLNRTVIYRSNGKKIKNAIDEIVQPGDIIEIPPSLLYQIVGGEGILKTISSVASIVTTFYLINSVAAK